MEPTSPASQQEHLTGLLSECRDRLAALDGVDTEPTRTEAAFLQELVTRIGSRAAELALPATEVSDAPLPLLPVVATPPPSPVAVHATAADPPTAPAQDGPLVTALRARRRRTPVASAPPLRVRPPKPVTPEPESPSLPWDRWLGERIFLKLALLLVVAGVAWAFKYAYDVGWWALAPAWLRIGAGVAVSGALMAAGLRYERRPEWQAFGRGLLAGGWPLLYFTVYAAHAFEASRIIHSPTLALLALCTTAGAAIAFSLRYRNQWITIAGYAFGYLALFLGGMSVAGLFAGAVFTISLVVVLCRFRWQWLGVVGLAGSTATYFAWLGLSLTFGGFRFDVGPEWFWPNITYPLVTWLAFAAGAHLASRDEPWHLPAYLAVKNAFVFFVCFAATPHIHDPSRLYMFPLALGAAHCLLAAHSRLAGRRPLFVAEVAVGVALVALAALVQLSGIWIGLAWAAQAVVLVLLGVWLAEAPLRRLGYLAFAVAAARTVLFDTWSPAGAVALTVGAVRDVGLLWLAATTWLAGRTLQRAREWELLESWESHGPTVARWLALGLVALTIGLDAGAAWTAPGFALLALGCALFTRRDDAQTTIQTAVLIGLAALAALATIATQQPDAIVWTSCAAVAAAAFLLARRGPLRAYHHVVATIAGYAWVLTQVAFPWNGPVAALVGLAISLRDGDRRPDEWRALGLLGTGVGLASCLSVLEVLGHGVAPGSRQLVLSVGAFAALASYALHVRRHGERPRASDGDVPPTTLLAMLLGLAGGAVAMATLHLELGPAWAGLGWAVFGAVIAVAARRAGLVLGSWLGLAALALGGGRTVLECLDAGIGVQAGVPLGAAVGVLAALLTTAARLHPVEDRALPAEALAGPLGALALAVMGAFTFQELSAAWLSLAWAAEGLLVLVAGFALRRDALRATGAGVLLVIAAKVCLFDVATLATPYRVASFLGLGLILLAAAYGYARLRALETRAAAE